jgi:hypothetical protein
MGVSPMTQLRRAGRGHEVNHQLKLEEDTSADDETAHVAEDVGVAPKPKPAEIYARGNTAERIEESDEDA